MIDVNTTQVVTEPDLKDAEVVNQQGVEGQVADDQKTDVLADGTSTDKTVPYSRLKEEVDRAKAAEEQAAHAQRQLELMQQKALLQANPPQQPKTSMEQALVDCDVAEDELYGENITKVMNRKEQIDLARTQQQQSAFSTQQFMVTHSDVSQVVGSVNPVTGQMMPTQELATLLAKKPHLIGACSTIQSAYQVVLDERELAKLQNTQVSNQEHLNRQGIDVKTEPLGGSAAGGGAAGDVNQTMMTREQTLEIIAKLDNGEQV